MRFKLNARYIRNDDDSVTVELDVEEARLALGPHHIETDHGTRSLSPREERDLEDALESWYTTQQARMLAERLHRIGS